MQQSRTETNYKIIPKDFSFDVEQEKVLIQCLDETLFQNYLIPKFHVEREIVAFEEDQKRQFAGEDIAVTTPGQEGRQIIDVKAQTNNYLNNPSPTFCLELGSANPTFKRLGWWLNKDIATTHYIFMWIDECDAKDITYINYAKQKKRRKVVEKAADIHKYRAMIINKEKARTWLANHGCTDDTCMQAMEMLKDDDNITVFKDPQHDIMRIYFDLMAKKLVKEKPWHGKFLTFTRTLWGEKEEQPINLVVKNTFWSEMANGDYVVENGVVTVEEKANTTKRYKKIS